MKRSRPKNPVDCLQYKNNQDNLSTVHMCITEIPSFTIIKEIQKCVYGRFIIVLAPPSLHDPAPWNLASLPRHKATLLHFAVRRQNTYCCGQIRNNRNGRSAVTFNVCASKAKPPVFYTRFARTTFAIVFPFYCCGKKDNDLRDCRRGIGTFLRNYCVRNNVTNTERFISFAAFQWTSENSRFIYIIE